MLFFIKSIIMKKLMLITCLFLISLSGFSQLQTQSDTLVVPVGDDSVFTFQGYARGLLYVEVDFGNSDGNDDTLGFGGSETPYDQSYGEYQSWNNPMVMNLTNFSDSVCRVERLSGLSAPWLKIRLTKGSSTAGLKYPITISFDRF